MGWLTSLLSGGAVKSIEAIASEWIETDMETAEAKALMVKTLDPNGLMRRSLGDRVASLYTIYLMTVLTMLGIEFSLSIQGIVEPAVAITTSKITDLFIPISSLFGLIVSASFGVNYANVKGNK